MEKEWKLILLESQFHSACNSVRLLGNELRNIHSCLVLELLQIEKKKNIKLNEELEAFKVARDKESKDVMYSLRQDEGESKMTIREQSNEDRNTSAHMVDSGNVQDEPIVLPSHLSGRSYSHCRTSKSNPTAAVTGNSNVLDSPIENHVEVAKTDESYPSVLLMEAEEQCEVIIVDKVEKEAERDQLITTLQLAEKDGKETTLSNREIVACYKGCSTQGKLMGKTLNLQLKREKFEVHKEEKQERITKAAVCKSKERVSYLQTPATVSTKVEPLLSSGPIFFHGMCCNLRYPKRTMESMKPDLFAADQASSPLKASLGLLESSPMLSDRETSLEIPMQDTSPTTFLLPNSVNASRRTWTKQKGKVLELNTSRKDKRGTKNKAKSALLHIEGSSKLSDMEHTSVMDSIAKQGGNKRLRYAGKKKENLKSNKRTEMTGKGGVDLSMTALDFPSPPKMRRTLFGITSKVKAENFELSAVNDEIYLQMSTSTRINTSNLIAPKLKKTPFMRT